MQPTTGAKFLDAATIQERFDDVETLEQRLDEDPGDLIASARLETIYRNEGAWEKLVQLILDRAEYVTSAEEKAALLHEVARIFSEQLADAERARVVLLTAFQHAPASMEIADALGQLAYDTGGWEDVITAYEEAARELVPVRPMVASELMLRVACAHIIGSGDWSRIGAALDGVQSLDPERSRAFLDLVERVAVGDEALETVAEVCGRIGDRPRMMRALSRASVAATDVLRRAHFHEAIGALHREDGDYPAAEWHFQEAVRLDPTCKGALEGLSDIYRARGEYRRIVELLEESRACARSRTARISLGLEAASVYAEELGEQTRALDLYAAALADDPEHTGAAEPLAERFFRQQRWQELEPILDMLLRRGGDAIDSESGTWRELYYRAGHCASQLGKFAKARRYYEQALRIDHLHLPSLLEGAEAYGQLQLWDAAYESLNVALLVQRDRRRPAPELAHTLYRMGESRRFVGDTDQALTLYESALDQARSDAALEAAISIYRQRGDDASIAQLLHAQIERTSGRTRVVFLSELADVVSRKLGDPHRAIDLYCAALEAEPDNRHILHQLVELYSAAERWREAVQTILLMAELEEEPLRRGKYYQAAGVISRHQLDPEDAIDYFNRALDCFFLEAGEIPESLRPGCMKAFSDIGKILYDWQEWKELERNYRRMIKRLKPDDPSLPELWHGLGHIYRKHLGHRTSAISSFEIASALDSDRLTHHRILIDLYEEAGPDKLDKAIERRRKLLEAQPFNAEHYAALRGLFQSTGDQDKVWCACRALAFLGQANPEELEYYRAWRPAQPIPPRSPLAEKHWTLLRHPDEDPLISTILGIVAEPAALETATSRRKLGLRDERDPAFLHLRGLFEGVRQALAITGAEGVVQPEVGIDVALANVARGSSLEPVFVLGRALYEGQTVHAIVHALARTLTYARPVYYLRLALPTEAELESVFLAACSLSRPNLPVPPALVSWAQRYAAALRKRISPHWERQLEQAVTAFGRPADPHDLRGWGQAVDATCRRAGLLLTGDLETAVAGIAREPQFTVGPSHEDKVRDLLVHSVSEEHFRLRRELGLHLDASFRYC